MLVKHAASVEPQQLREGVGIRWLLASPDGAPNFAMRLIELQPGIVFEPHAHPFEHEIYVLEGAGMVTTPAGDSGVMEPGVSLLIMPDEPHGYRNTGDTALKFICVIPLQQKH